MSSIQARLILPAQPEFVGVARLTIAGLATRLGFDYDQVEDIRLALAEAMTLLLRGDEDSARIDVQAGWSAASLELLVRRDGGEPLSLDRDDAAIALMVMEALMETATYETEPTGAAVRLVKSRGAA